MTSAASSSWALVGAPLQRPALDERPTSYAVRLRKLRTVNCVGVTLDERATAQPVMVDIDLEFKGERYPVSDELSGAADYGEVASIVELSAQGFEDALLETFVLRTARGLARRWPAAARVRVAATKLHVPLAPEVAEAVVEATLGDG